MITLTVTGLTPEPARVIVADRTSLLAMVNAFLSSIDVLSATGVTAEGLFPELSDGIDSVTFAKVGIITFSIEEPISPDEEEVGDPIYHYVLMRQDVPDYLSGKAQAQANHAGTKMVMDGLNSGSADLIAMINEWGMQGGGFGTCIVLMVSAPEMRQTVSLAQLLGLHTGIVHDPSYPLRDGEKIQTLPLDTCAFLIGRKSQCFPIVGRFPLLRDKGEQ